MAEHHNTTPSRIVNAAAELFSSSAYADVTVERIAEQAGITKMTLYQYFHSKDQLALESLRMRLNRREERLDTFLAQIERDSNPLLAVFDWLEGWLDPARFKGCSFVKAVNELSAVLPEVRSIALEAKQKIRSRFTKLAKDAGAAHPKELGQQLALLFEGAQTLGLIEESAEPARVAKRIATLLVRN